MHRLFVRGLYEHYKLLFIHHTVHVTESDVMIHHHCGRSVVWLLESMEMHRWNMDDTANISSQSDVHLYISLLSVALHCAAWICWTECTNVRMLHCHCLLLHVLFIPHCNLWLRSGSGFEWLFVRTHMNNNTV